MSSTKPFIVLVISGLALLASCAPSGNERMEDTAQYHVELAQGHWDGGQVPQAIEELEFALALDPEMKNAHYLLGFIYSGRGMLPQSIQHYRQALLIDPEWHEAKNNLGVVYLQLERWEEAEELFS